MGGCTSVDSHIDMRLLLLWYSSLMLILHVCACAQVQNANCNSNCNCNCPTELIATYLDKITTPLVQSLPSYVKDTKHMLQLTESFRFPGNNNYVFTMDVKSLYTTIPNRDGLLALAQFLDKRPALQPSTHTLVRLAELVLTLNTFSFNRKFYKQTGGVAMGSRLGPNYACLFMGHIEEQIFEQYTGTVPALYQINDTLTTLSELPPAVKVKSKISLPM